MCSLSFKELVKIKRKFLFGNKLCAIHTLHFIDIAIFDMLENFKITFLTNKVLSCQ